MKRRRKKNAYKAFLGSIKLPGEYAERMLSSKYAQHFYSREERRAIYTKWSGV